MRRWLVIFLGSMMVGGSSGAALAMPQLDSVRVLMGGIFDDITAIAESFAGGPNDPHSPVVDPSALARDKARLDSATNKAQALSDELRRLQPQPQPDRGH
jgi:hypothetical protein